MNERMESMLKGPFTLYQRSAENNSILGYGFLIFLISIYLTTLLQGWSGAFFRQKRERK